MDELKNGIVKLSQKVIVKKEELQQIKEGVQADPKIKFSFKEKNIDDDVFVIMSRIEKIEYNEGNSQEVIDLIMKIEAEIDARSKKQRNELVRQKLQDIKDQLQIMKAAAGDED